MLARKQIGSFLCCVIGMFFNDGAVAQTLNGSNHGVHAQDGVHVHDSGEGTTFLVGAAQGKGCKACRCKEADCGLCQIGRCPQARAPNMIGDFFGGYSAGTLGTSALDRLLVVANDLDAPGVLPPAGATLTISEPGPVGIFSSTVISVQQLQQLLRTGAPLPPANLVGSVADNATMTTTMTIAQIQALLASTPEAYDIVSLVAPPASYASAVDTAFQARNGAGGVTAFDGASSGALLQSGVDTLNGGEDFDAFYYYTYGLLINVPSPSAGLGSAGRIKISSGNSPIPRDRVYFHYGIFSGVPFAPGTDIDRFLPGFEKTFFGGNFSVEMRFPFAATLDSDFVTGGLAGNDVEFGNLAIYLKALLYGSERLAVSAGLGVTLPTADGISVTMANNTPVLRIENESVHLQPFLAALYTPNDRFFTQGFLQLDIDANGNQTLVNSGGGLAPVGVLNDATYLFADLGVGYWAYQSTTSHLTGIAPTAELYYNASLQSGDSITAGALRIGNFGDNVDALNVMLGATFEFGNSTNLAVGYVAPVGGDADRQLNGGFRILLDHYPRRGIR